MKYDIPLLDRNTRFPLWQVKLRDFLIQMDLYKAFLGFEKMPTSWTEEEKEMKDLKALSQIRLHLSNDALDSKEKMKHITGSRDASAEGLQARGYKASGRGRYPQPSSEANSKSEGRRKFCNYCQKKGHEIEDCFKLRNKIAEKDKLDGHNQASASGESDVAEVGFVGELL